MLSTHVGCKSSINKLHRNEFKSQNFTYRKKNLNIRLNKNKHSVRITKHNEVRAKKFYNACATETTPCWLLQNARNKNNKIIRRLKIRTRLKIRCLRLFKTCFSVHLQHGHSNLCVLYLDICNVLIFRLSHLSA